MRSFGFEGLSSEASVQQAIQGVALMNDITPRYAQAEVDTFGCAVPGCQPG